MKTASKFRLCAIAAGAALAAAFAVPATAQDYYYRHENCYDRNADASAGGALTGAVVGGAAAGPVGAVVGAAVGGSAGDDSVHCRYEHDEYGYNGGYYRDGGYYDDNGYYGNRAGVYGGNYREGYGDGYADAAERYNGSDRGYRYDDAYYARRPSYHGGYYDGYGFWHPASDDTNYRRY